MHSKTTSFNVPEQLLTRLDSRVDLNWGVSRSAALSRDLDTYYSLLSISMRKVRAVLTKNEALLILDVMNGTVVTTGPAAELWSGSALQHEISDAIHYDALSQKWDVDPNLLLEKLNSLEHFDRYALVDWAREMWSNSSNSEDKAKTWEKELALFSSSASSSE